MITIRLVSTQEDKQAFLKFPITIHNQNNNWIQPLNQDIEKVFDPKINKCFRNGVCERWLFFKDNIQVAQVATFINSKYVNEIKVGGIGFFDCINDQTIANFVLDHCKQWMLEKGMQAMDGPINFGERLKWWGLLVEGFHEPLYEMNYHPPYYQQLFENYGFKNYFNQECYGMKVEHQFSEKMLHAHANIKKNSDFRIRKINKDKLAKFASDFRTVYNKAFATHGSGKVLDERQVQKMFESMKIVLDENIAFIVYFKEEPIGAWINLPDLNQYFKHFKGRLGWWQKLKFLWMKNTDTCKRMVGIVFGVVPEWHGKGVDSYMIIEGSQHIFNKAQYIDYEMQWIGDFNPKMINVAKHLGASITRKLTTYRYIIDPAISFERHPIIGK